MNGPQGPVGETGCSGNTGRSTHTINYFDIRSTSASTNPGNYATLKLFFIPANALNAQTIYRLTAFSRSNVNEGESAFRIRIEERNGNNVILEYPAENVAAQKTAVQIVKDSTNNNLHLYSNGNGADNSLYSLGANVSSANDLFVFYEVRIETVGVTWTNDFIVSEVVSSA
jgi:hypothetical protein